MFASLALAATLALVPAVPLPADPGEDGARWVTVLAYDEVRVDVDTTHLGGAGPVSAWLRWTLADRAASPAAWDLGARVTVDAIEVECGALASRTLQSAAVAADGSAVDAASYTDGAAAWRRHAPASVGGQVVAAVCRLAGAGR